MKLRTKDTLIEDLKLMVRVVEASDNGYCECDMDWVRAAIDRLEEYEDRMKWMPIETAPKDGTPVLIWLQPPYSRVERARWFARWANWIVGDFPDEGEEEWWGIGSSIPTHWMPLPPPPQEQE